MRRMWGIVFCVQLLRSWKNDSLPLVSSLVRKSAPRARGDGPAEVTADQTVGICSPRTRGWTRQPQDGGAPTELLPAHAGMDPPTRLVIGYGAAAPRARGDGPLYNPKLEFLGVWSPRTRGWTPAAPLPVGDTLLLPAHAGMDPLGRRGGTEQAQAFRCATSAARRALGLATTRRTRCPSCGTPGLIIEGGQSLLRLLRSEQFGDQAFRVGPQPRVDVVSFGSLDNLRADHQLRESAGLRPEQAPEHITNLRSRCGGRETVREQNRSVVACWSPHPTLPNR